MGVPKKASTILETAVSFETKDVTKWSLGKATCGSVDRDNAFLITSGGCSCFISGLKHGSETLKLEPFERLMKLLLKEARYVSLLIHETRGDIASDTVVCRHKSPVSLTEIINQVGHLQLDVRYILTD